VPFSERAGGAGFFGAGSDLGGNRQGLIGSVPPNFQEYGACDESWLLLLFSTFFNTSTD